MITKIVKTLTITPFYKTQQRNRRDNVKFNGKTIPEWSEISGIKITTLSARIKRGLTIEQAIKK